MTLIVIIVVLVLVCTVIVHYLGFATEEEYLFFNRKSAQSLFFLFLSMFVASAYFFYLELQMPKTLAMYMTPYHNADPSILSSLHLKSEDTKKWTFVTNDLAKEIKEFYLRKKNYDGWVIKSKTEEGLLIFGKGDLSLTITTKEQKNDKSKIYYVLKDRSVDN
ncbi:MAG: hypothetical protein KAI71_03010 [Candidatus Pacebacteria bacterium]|nr:hypothetical protein [Candidatus Paceibacterota bacterium]